MQKLLLILIPMLLIIGIVLLIVVRGGTTGESGTAGTTRGDAFPVEGDVQERTDDFGGTDTDDRIARPVETEPEVEIEHIELSESQIEDITRFADPIGEGDHGDYTVYETDALLIQFDGLDEQVIVVIKSGNPVVVRAEAESYLMSKLNLTATELCGLDATVSVRPQGRMPYKQDIGFSACPRS